MYVHCQKNLCLHLGQVWPRGGSQLCANPSISNELGQNNHFRHKHKHKEVSCIVYRDHKIWVYHTNILWSQIYKLAWFMLQQQKYSFPIAMDNPLKLNNFRNCLGKAVVKWQTCGFEIEDQHLRRSDKKSCWAKRINIWEEVEKKLRDQKRNIRGKEWWWWHLSSRLGNQSH